jgi:hypothetical protein
LGSKAANGKVKTASFLAIDFDSSIVPLSAAVAYSGLSIKSWNSFSGKRALTRPMPA